MLKKIGNKITEMISVLDICHVPEESFRWFIACELFPTCWCCAGLRGVVYGVLLTNLIYVFLI